MVVRLYCEWYAVDWCHKTEEKSRRQIREGHHSEAGTG